MASGFPRLAPAPTRENPALSLHTLQEKLLDDFSGWGKLLREVRSQPTPAWEIRKITPQMEQVREEIQRVINANAQRPIFATMPEMSNIRGIRDDLKEITHRMSAFIHQLNQIEVDVSHNLTLLSWRIKEL